MYWNKNKKNRYTPAYPSFVYKSVVDGPQILTLFFKHFNVFKLSNYHLNINNCQ